mmetsp:Transcript_17042/g.25200  ORF Transcript_17042/g.25200 Transcript_17042/m.25200 type:complete len:82 (-) Transcript_17042:212-457(-)
MSGYCEFIDPQRIILRYAPKPRARNKSPKAFFEKLSINPKIVPTNANNALYLIVNWLIVRAMAVPIKAEPVVIIALPLADS